MREHLSLPDIDRNRDKIKNIMRIIKLTTSIFLMVMLLNGCYVTNHTNGEKMGKIVSVERSGILNRTWECQLAIRGSQNNATAGLFYFTIRDNDTESLIRAKAYMNYRSDVVVKYSSPTVGGCMSTDSHRFAETIESRQPL